MPDFNTKVTKTAGISFLKPTAAVTLAGQGSSMPAAAVAVMERGPVGRPFRVTGRTLESVCGGTLPMRDGVHGEGLRHVRDALKGCEYVDLVRVVPADAAMPLINFLIDPDGGSDEPVETSAVAYGDPITAASGAWLTIWPTSGDPSTNIKISIEITDAAAGKFDLSFIEVAGASEVVLETISVSNQVSARNDRGLSIYLPSYLADNAYGYECIIDPNADLTNVGALESAFIGGTNGTVSSLVASDYIDAWDLLDDDELGWRAGFAAGIYDATVIAKAQAVCLDRLAEFRFDAPPWMTQKAAIEWMKANSPAGYLSRCTHYPYLANDQDYGGKSLWGISGTMTALKADCVALPTNHASVSGWHFVPAGQTRGRIGRSGVEPLHFKEKATGDELVDARLNTAAQGIYCNDCLSASLLEDDFKYEQVGAVMSAMAYDLSSSLNSLKFDPASGTRQPLEDLAEELASRYYNAGSLVDPTTQEVPYLVEVSQAESDYWFIEIRLKVTGVTRRIGVQFRQVK